MNIIIVGPRAVGKTTVAKLLAKKLNRTLIETDDLIARRVGLPIRKIVSKYGWDYFRTMESEVIDVVSKLDNCIISTGGGTITNNENVKNLKKNGIFVLLQASVDTLMNRMKNNKNRPALTNKSSLQEEIETVLREREKQYKESANICLQTDNASAIEVADKIIIEVKNLL